MIEEHKKFMLEAARQATLGVKKGGGPFGAVIVQDGEIVGAAYNEVVTKKDPTAHAEIEAIRAACRVLNTHNLARCTIYSSCEPCPMCLSAIYWAHIDRIFYGCSRTDANRIGFDDQYIYDELDLPISKRNLQMTQLLKEEANKALEDWEQKADKVLY